MKNIFNYVCVTLAISLAFSCTDLEIEPTDSLITAGFAGVADVESEVANLQNTIANGNLATQDGLFALNEVSTDEYFVPTRGSDWGDNGRWLALHRQTWNAELQDIVNTWRKIKHVFYILGKATAISLNISKT